MKVKEYVSEYLISVDTNEKELEQIGKLCVRLYSDFFEIIKQRNTKKTGPICAALKEINNRWIKICESREGVAYGLIKGGFITIFEDKHPEIYRAYQIINK